MYTKAKILSCSSVSQYAVICVLERKQSELGTQGGVIVIVSLAVGITYNCQIYRSG